MLLTAADLEIASRTVWAEARGEPYHGKLAVAHVLINRWNSKAGQFRKDDTLASTCLRHLQFSAWTLNDPNFGLLHTVGLADATYRNCMRAVLEALDGEDLTRGSTHYHTTAIEPFWVKGHDPVVVIGRHAFYVGIK